MDGYYIPHLEQIPGNFGRRWYAIYAVGSTNFENKQSYN